MEWNKDSHYKDDTAKDVDTDSKTLVDFVRTC